jgi:hypothetical protein
MCYYYFDDFERSGLYEMIASDRGNEDYIEKWRKEGAVGKKDVIS